MGVDQIAFQLLQYKKYNQKQNGLLRIHDKDEKKSEDTARKRTKNRNQCGAGNDHTDQSRVRHAKDR